ncbi:respiratory burst oxidase homolog protein A-like isoform X2 [Vicia villosa]|uniref:respiratory burst oxidase homolog protein A-like isoform X2 n=1 Tax=Vicia villosa TaxID=3911 RepID=UPI00273C8BA5|nr:respiratory burst oxidase homolog protein A-like isoform X2 [Vicia villosa]
MDEEHVKSKTSLLALFKSSPSSSSLSYSSSSYSSNTSSSTSPYPAQNAIHSFTPVRTGFKASHHHHVAQNEAIETMGMRFFNDIFGHGGILKWKDVENRFDQVAWTGNSPEPVMSWPEFGFCIGIGMQSSPELARELLRALRGCQDWKSDITKTELHSFWLRMNEDSFNSRMRMFFDMCNRNMDGRITETDIKQTILLTASINKLSVTRDEAEDYAGLIMESVDKKNKGYIEYRRRSGFEVMGYCLPTAKGAAETLKFNMALVLLPVCRNTITWLRKDRRLNYVVPFNDNINFHKLIAGGIVVGVILHGGTHLTCDFPRISDSDKSIFRQTIAAGFGYHQPTYMEILATTEVASGIGMVVLMAIAFSLATKWPRRRSPVLPLSLRRVTGYNTFWYSHHLFVVVYVLLIVHSMFLFLTDKWIEKTTWMYIAFPVLLYAGERIFRAIRSGSYEVDIMKASLYPGKVLHLKMQKPDGFKYRSGMYIFIQCPQISPFQWHPFSLTSGPQDEYLSVHIRTLGDWSYQIYALFQEAVLSGLQGGPKLYIDGPYGSASQDHVKYDILVLIGLGIGATPFISILKDVANGVQTSQNDHSGLRECSLTKGSPSKAYLYWVTREQNSFDWFRDVIKEIAGSTKQKSVVEMHNFLTSVYPEGDVRSALLSVIQALNHAKNGIDIVSRTPIHTHFARPNWFNIFSRLARKHVGAKIGVFYCGPSNLATELKNLCTKFSTKTTTRFVFHKENY